MPRAPFQVYIKCYDDLSNVQHCVASINGDAPIYVVDGRYADFPGDTVRTPGLREWCEDQANVTYHSPPDDRLPWGHEHVDAAPQLRYPIHEQACYANYEVLPQDAWILHLDTDERLDRFDRDLLDDLDPRVKVVPYIDSLADRGIGVPRLYQPRHWTFWIAGVMYPREYWSRETPVARLAELHERSLAHQAINRRSAPDAIRIHNTGADRTPEYHLRRACQLATMGRHARARQYVNQVRERAPDVVAAHADRLASLGLSDEPTT